MPRNNLSRRYNPELVERNDAWDRKFCRLFWSPFEIDTPLYRTEGGRVEELPASAEVKEPEVILKESSCSDKWEEDNQEQQLSAQMDSLNVAVADFPELDPLALVTVEISESSSSEEDNDDAKDVDYGSDPLPFRCRNCRKRFRLARYLRAHSVVHSGDRSFRCDCGKSFRNRASLYIHRKRAGHQDVPAVGVRCDACGQLFRSSAFLSRHTAAACVRFKLARGRAGGSEEGA